MTTRRNSSSFQATTWKNGRPRTTCPSAWHIPLPRIPAYYGPEPQLLLSIRENGGTAGVAVRTPPHRIVLVVDVPLSPSRLRHAEMEDLPLMAKWIAKFSSEAIGEEPEPGRAERNAEKYIAERKLYVWDHDGPVSIVKESRAMKSGTMIALVYTPPELRNRGYATSCVYHLTKRLLAGDYKFCSLFTDLANPTSNHIYPKVGYAPLGDTLEFDFDFTGVHDGSQVVT